MSENQIETLYVEARQALKAKDYERASDLLKQILVLDEEYKDASRLLAQLVREKHRRWYNEPRLWGSVIGAVVVGLLVWFLPTLPWQKPATLPTPMVSPTSVALPTQAATSTIAPTLTMPLPTFTPAATAIPLAWKRISLGQEFPHDAITAIVFDPKTTDVIYVGTQNAGMYKSLDGGLSWQPIQRGLNRASIASLAIDSQHPEILFAGANFGGVYKTTDGGQNWFPINSGIDITEGADNFSLVVNDPQNSLNLFFTNGGGFYRSTDGGESWIKLQAGLEIDYILVNPVTPSELLRIEFIGNRHIISKSLDDGLTWKKTDINLDSPWSWGEWKLVANPLRPGEVFAYNPNGRPTAFHSDDFGDHWKGLISETNSCGTIAFDAFDGGKAYCVRVSGVYLVSNAVNFFQFSNDAGQSWQPLGQLDIPIQVLAVSPMDNKYILAGGKDGLRASIDGGLSWEPINSGLGVSYASFLADVSSSGFLSLVVASVDTKCIDCETLLISRDKGHTWEVWQHGWKFSSGANGFYWTKNLFEKLNWRGVGYASSGPGNAPQMISLPQDNLLLSPDAYLSNRLFAANYCENNDHFYFSEDKGVTWKTGNLDGKPLICDAQFHFAASDPKQIYLTSDLALFRSEDGGLSWTSCELPDYWRLGGSRDGRLAVDSHAAQHILLATRGNGILTSTDGCRSWLASSAGLGSLYINAVVIDPQKPDTVYAGTDSGAYISTDGGKTWGQINDGLLGATVVYSLMVDKDSNTYAATPYGIFKLEGK